MKTLEEKVQQKIHMLSIKYGEILRRIDALSHEQSKLEIKISALFCRRDILIDLLKKYHKGNKKAKIQLEKELKRR